MQSTVLILYLILCCALGFFRVPAMKTFRDYALGSVQFSTLTLSLSMVAAIVDSRLVIGMVGRAADLGMVFILPNILYPLQWWMISRCICMSLPYLRDNNCVSLADIMTLFYGKTGRLCSIIALVLFLFFLGTLYRVSGIVLERYCGIPLLYGAGIIALSIAIYSIFGGAHAVVTTDVIQFFIFIAILPAIIIFALVNIDIGSTINKIPAENLTITPSNYPLLLSTVLYKILPITGFEMIQRCLMCRDEKQIKAVCRNTAYVLLVFVSLLYFVGLITKGLDPLVSGDEVMFAFLDQTVAESLKPFIVISFLAVIMSTASSFMNSVSVALIKTVIFPLFPHIKDHSNIKFIGFLVSFVSFLTLLFDQDVLETFFTLDAFWDPIITIPLMMGLIGYRVTPQQFKYVVINSIVVTCISMYIIEPGSIIVWAISVIASIITIVFIKVKTEVQAKFRRNLT